MTSWSLSGFSKRAPCRGTTQATSELFTTVRWVWIPLTEYVVHVRHCGDPRKRRGWGVMLLAGRSWVRDPTRWIHFSNLPNHSSRTGLWDLISLGLALTKYAQTFPKTFGIDLHCFPFGCRNTCLPRLQADVQNVFQMLLLRCYLACILRLHQTHHSCSLHSLAS
jgi:hypothetical protein